MTAGVYRILNEVNGKFYVGSSVDIEKRWRRHVLDLEQNRHHSLHLQRAWDKYGPGAFSMEILECMPSSSKRERFEKEQEFISEKETFRGERGYNVAKMAAGGSVPRVTSDEEGEIVELYVYDKLSAAKIADRYDFTRQTVYDVLRRRGVRRRGRKEVPGHLSEKEEGKIEKMYLIEKKTQEAIARELGVGRRAICEALKRRKVETRGGEMFSSDEQKEIVSLWKGGMTQTALAKKFLCNVKTIKRVLLLTLQENEHGKHDMDKETQIAENQKV